jgi:Yip1-like protein
MSGTARCDQCGLTQFFAESCRRCGAPMVRAPLARPRPLPARIHPFRGIWLSPRETIRSLVNTDPTRGVLVLSWLGGFAIFLDGMTSKVEEKFPLAAAMVAAVVLGPLLSFALVFVQALLTAVTGRLLGGAAGPRELRAALAWAEAPLLCLFLLWVLRLMAAATPWKILVDVAGLLVILWSEALAVALVAEVHDFSLGRALGAVVGAWAIKIALLIGLVLFLARDLPSRPKDERSGPETGSGGRERVVETGRA